jgi:hypothetical protein
MPTRPPAGTLLLAVLLLVLAGPPPAAAATHTVTCNATAGQQLYDFAHTLAGANDTIVVPACTITLPLPITTTATPLTIIGAGAARTILDGGGTIPLFTIGGSHTVTLVGMTLRNGHGNQGGGIFNGGIMTLIDTVVTGNTAGGGAIAGDGGGIANFGVLTMIRSTVSGNTAAGGVAFGGRGGGIYHDANTLTLTNTVVSGNTAAAGTSGSGKGGGLFSVGIVALTSSTISGNSALGVAPSSGLGGGIVADGGILAATNVTISGNTAGAGGAVGGTGGGLAALSSSVAVAHSTIDGNTAAPVNSAGGGVHKNGGTLTLLNTILAANTATTGANCGGAGITSLGHNLSQDGSCAAVFTATGDLNNANPQLGPLQNNGGVTPTHALLPGSAAIDTGDDTKCPATDQRGVSRPVDGTGDGAPRCDIGAVEARPAGILVSTGTGAGGGPHVKLFRVDGAGSPTQLGGGFFAYDPGFIGGVQATLVSVGGELFVVTGVGSGGGPHIKLFKVTDLAAGNAVQVGPGFLAYDPGFTGGARVAATGDDQGQMMIVTGVGSGGGAHVKVFEVTDRAAGTVVQLGGGFFAYDPAFLGGVNVGAE